MIFDNADVLSPAELEAYFPPGRGRHILITSCSSTMRNLTSLQNSLKVTGMEENDAIELLLKASCLDPLESQAEASKIVKKLYCVPLAINQAGAYIATGATSIKDYLAKYFQCQKTLLSHSKFTGASEYNRAVYVTWELSYKEIQQRAKSDDSHKANAAKSAMLLLELFSFFHHEEISEKIFSNAALQKDEKTFDTELLASSMLNQRLLHLNKAGTWDNSLFREGIWVLLSFSLIKNAPYDGVYAMHPLVHAWARDRLDINERKKCCLMAYVTLSSSLRKDEGHSYEFQRVLVTHVRAIIEHSKSENGQNVVGYLDDAYIKFGDLLWKQGYPKEAETLQIEVLDTRSKIFGVEHPDTIMAMANLAATYHHLGKYTDAEKLNVQVLDSGINSPGPEHTNSMATDIAALQVQVLDAQKKVAEAEHSFMTEAMANLATNGKLLVLAAKTALQHLQQCEVEIKAALSLSGISEMDYTLLAGFNESVIHSGIGYLEEIHVILKSEFPPKDALLSSLGRIFSPFPGMIFTTFPPYCLKTPVFNSEGNTQEWDEIVFTQTHTYTAFQMGYTMKEMEVMSTSISPNEGKVPSGSGGGGGGNKKKQGENILQGKRIGGNSQKGSEKDSEGDDDESEGDDPDDPDSSDNSDTHLPQIFFNIQTEIYPYASPMLASEPSSSKPSKCFQLLQLEGSITVQVGFSSQLIHMTTFNLLLDKISTAGTKAPSKLLYSIQKTQNSRNSRGGFCLLPPDSL